MIEVGVDDLLLYCLIVKMLVWNYYLCVFFDIVDIGEVKCLYCGIVYKLVFGVELKGYY